MGKKSQPALPDYQALATQQGTANQEAATSSSLMSNPNMVTPYGSSMYSGPVDGSGRPTITQQLSPAEQAKLDASDQAQLGALGILNGDMSNISSALSGAFGMTGSAGRMDPNAGGPVQGSLNYSGSPALVGTDEATRQQAQNATYRQGAQYLDPQFRNLQSDTTTNLANQGLTPGSAAYERAKLDVNNQQQRAYSDLGNTAILAGNQALAQQQAAALANRSQISGETTTAGQFANAAQQQRYNDVLQTLQQNNAGRAQDYSEYSANRTMPINMLNALLGSSQVNNPTFQPNTPTTVAPAPIMQGGQLQGQAETAQYSANQAKLGQMYSALGSAAGAKISDRRLKSSIVAVGSYGPFTLYDFDLFGKRERGVMADEVEKIVPQAVITGPDGYKRVNYAMIGL